jgi:hypothetical protein
MARRVTSKSQITVRRLSVNEAGIDLEALAKRVSLHRDYAVLEKDGIPIAGVIGIDDLEDYLELQDPEVCWHIQKSNEDFLAGRLRPSGEFAAELQREGRKRTKGRAKGRTRRERGGIHYEQLARDLLKAHPEFRTVQAQAFKILDSDPQNRTRAHRIKHLAGIPPGGGQWRLSLDRFRFRYDMYSLMLVMQYCGLRPVT